MVSCGVSTGFQSHQQCNYAICATHCFPNFSCSWLTTEENAVLRRTLLNTMHTLLRDMAPALPKLWGGTENLCLTLQAMAGAVGTAKQDLHEAAAQMLSALLRPPPSAQAADVSDDMLPMMRSHGVKWERAMVSEGGKEKEFLGARDALAPLQKLTLAVPAPSTEAAARAAAAATSALEPSGDEPPQVSAGAAGAALHVVRAFSGLLAWAASTDGSAVGMGDGSSGDGGTAVTSACDRIGVMVTWVEGLGCSMWRGVLLAALLQTARVNEAVRTTATALDAECTHHGQHLVGVCISAIQESADTASVGQCAPICEGVAEVLPLQLALALQTVSPTATKERLLSAAIQACMRQCTQLATCVSESESPATVHKAGKLARCLQQLNLLCSSPQADSTSPRLRQLVTGACDLFKVCQHLRHLDRGQCEAVLERLAQLGAQLMSQCRSSADDGAELVEQLEVWLTSGKDGPGRAAPPSQASGSANGSHSLSLGTSDVHQQMTTTAGQNGSPQASEQRNGSPAASGRQKRSAMDSGCSEQQHSRPRL
eukprot:TRINITY_DN6725_c0_g2_i2.p1 TRINITY_DN6725_c0_g2~~TRINITY_DN6725_c0_g2_i2.p1  ORF type:complete len:541 (+),score=120.43 TRINITY_DN6725_c0_g2_i2:378-2000(+)